MSTGNFHNTYLGSDGGLHQRLLVVPWPRRTGWLRWDSAACIWRPVSFGQECRALVASFLSAPCKTLRALLPSSQARAVARLQNVATSQPWPRPEAAATAQPPAPPSQQ